MTRPTLSDRYPQRQVCWILVTNAGEPILELDPAGRALREMRSRALVARRILEGVPDA